MVCSPCLILAERSNPWPGFKPMIDSFFDSVLVMDKDDSVRRNRLALLTRTRALFARVADFGKFNPPDRSYQVAFKTGRV